MESLRVWVLALSGAALATAALCALVQPGPNKGAFRVLCAVAVLYVLVLPLRGLSLGGFAFDTDVTAQTAPEAALRSNAQEAALFAAETALRQQITDKLREAGQTPESVVVRCAYSGDGIAPVQIVLRGRIDRQTAAGVLRPYLTAQTKWELLTEETDDD